MPEPHVGGAMYSRISRTTDTSATRCLTKRSKRRRSLLPRAPFARSLVRPSEARDFIGMNNRVEILMSVKSNDTHTWDHARMTYSRITVLRASSRARLCPSPRHIGKTALKPRERVGDSRARRPDLIVCFFFSTVVSPFRTRFAMIFSAIPREPTSRRCRTFEKFPSPARSRIRERILKEGTRFRHVALRKRRAIPLL